MKIDSIDIENVQFHEKLSIEAGPNRTIIEGANGVGKSSFLNAIRNAIYGAASLLGIARFVNGEPTEPKVSIKFSGGGPQVLLTKAGDKTPTIKSQVGTSAAFEVVKKPGEYLRTITEASADPGKFLTAPAKDQEAMLLAALPVAWDQARADQIVGEFLAIVEAENLPLENLYPLQKVAAIRGAIFRARTGVNVDEKSKRAAADQTLRDAPAEIPQGVEGRIAEKRAEIAGRQSALSTEKEKWLGAYRAAEKAAEVKRDAAIAAARATYGDEIGAANIAAADAKAMNASDQANLDAANAELSTLLRDQNDATKVKTMHETAAKFTADADSLAGKADRMTAILAALDAFRADLVQEIPIHGLTLDGGIKIGGVPFEQCNTATRVAIAFSVATLRLKGLQLKAVFCDNLEALDDASRAHLYSVAEENGVQLFGAMRTEGPLKVVRA